MFYLFNWSFLPGSTNRIIFKWISIKTIPLYIPVEFIVQLHIVQACFVYFDGEEINWARAIWNRVSEIQSTKVTTFIHLSSLVAVIWEYLQHLCFLENHFANKFNVWSCFGCPSTIYNTITIVVVIYEFTIEI